MKLKNSNSQSRALHGLPVYIGAPASSIFPMTLRCSAPSQQYLCHCGAPGQQQTLFVGEKYSGLASNLAPLGRIC